MFIENLLYFLSLIQAAQHVLSMKNVFMDIE